MAEYIGTLVFVAMAVGILEFLSYGARSRKTARLCASVLLIHSVLTPLLGAALSLGEGDIDLDFDCGEGYIQGEYESAAETAFGEGIYRLLVSEYGIKREDASVNVYGFDFEKMRAERIVIILSGAGALADRRTIAQYITESGLGECEVRIRIG